jgi:large subunit ribosomal protein L25
MVEVIAMPAQVRERAGKGPARAVRRAGRVPAVVYGAKQDPLMISLDPRDLMKALRTGSFLATVYDLKMTGAKERVLPRDVQFHPVTDAAIHVDFLRVSATTSVTVHVPVEFLNEEDSPGLKRGGLLNVVRHDIEMVCRADAIPPHIDIDLTGLEIGDSVHISMVKLPEGVQPTITDRDFTIATIAAPTVVRDEALEAAEAAEAEAAEGEEAEAAEGEEAEGEKKEGESEE